MRLEARSGIRATGKEVRMRPATMITLAVLLVAIVGALVVQLVIS